MKTAALFLTLFLMQPWHPAHAAEELDVVVNVVRDGEAFTVDATMHVPVTQQDAWTVLADFDHFADFIPNMQTSRIVSKPGEPLRIEQKGKARYGLLSFSYESLREVELVPFDAIKSRLVKGNMKKLETLTRLSSEDGGTRVIYHSDTIPDFWLPPLIGPALVRHEVAEQFRAFIREMLRRKGNTAK